MNPRYKAILSAAALLGAGYASVRPLGPVPPLGSLLDPVHGVWGVARNAEHAHLAARRLPGLGGQVEVVYDDRRVPHVFASSLDDAYRGLGYVVARDRLFQMELQARATAGTLTELAGDRLLGADRQSRRLGLAWAAERDFERLAQHPVLLGPLEAYAEGVNAFIDGMRAAELPFEYHLLGRKPTRWEPVHTLYLLKRMGWTLAFNSIERRKAFYASRVGREAADALLPGDHPIQEPILPHAGLRFIGGDFPPPGDPDPSAHVQMETAQAMLGPLEASRDDGGPVLGSNNWAVAPQRSESGNAILAGDPHLGLTLPSIWYEAHLTVPGELDAYGVTLMGTPAIIIGFNRDVAWTFTNTGSDVMDYYVERFDDADAPTRYLVDGTWRPLEARIEEYRNPRGKTLHTDTLYHTHRGPVLTAAGQPTSLRWTVLEDQGEIDALARANRATSVGEWLQIMEGWHAPTQNGLVADRTGHIAIQAAGYYPLRPDNTTGDWFFDGTTGASDWVGSMSRIPRSVDPPQGYLASANQQPVDPDQDDAYLGAGWPAPWRAMTINALLRGKEKHSAADLEAYQTHPESARARLFVPTFLRAVEHLAVTGGSSPDLTEAAELLSEWDQRYTLDSKRAVLFETAITQLQRRLWDELDNEDGSRGATPSLGITWSLMDRPDSPWWDDRSTGRIETRDVILAESLVRALAQLRDRLGPESGDAWRWDNVRRQRIMHLLQIPALSREGIPVQGGPGLLNPSSGSGTHGASWRMVVELGDEVRARGTYPGGQSGNPLSAGYTDRLGHWTAGRLEDLRFPTSAEALESEGRVIARLTLLPGGGS